MTRKGYEIVTLVRIYANDQQREQHREGDIRRRILFLFDGHLFSNILDHAIVSARNAIGLFRVLAERIIKNERKIVYADLMKCSDKDHYKLTFKWTNTAMHLIVKQESDTFTFTVCIISLGKIYLLIIVKQRIMLI
jgi:hypothetical protein